MKKFAPLYIAFLLCTVLFSFGQNSFNRNDALQTRTPVLAPASNINLTPQRSTKFPAPVYTGGHSNSRSQNLKFMLDYGALDQAYNINGPNQGSGFFYKNDASSLKMLNSRLPIDSTAISKWVMMLYPNIIDMQNNPDWPFTEYAANRINMQIDTLYMDLGHIKKSASKDTIVLSVWSLDDLTTIGLDTGATGLLLGRITVVTDTSLMGGTGEGSQPGSFMLGTYPFVPSSPIIIPSGKRFLVQVDFYGPGSDNFIYFSSRRNDCASQCGASPPYINFDFNSSIYNFNTLAGLRYKDATQSGIYPSSLFYTDCNTDGTKDTTCEDLTMQNLGLYPVISAVIPNFYVEATSSSATACPGANIILTANGGGSMAMPYTYSWTSAHGFLTSNSEQQVELQLGANVLNDTVIVTLTDANNVNVYDTVIIKTGGLNIAITNAQQPIVLSCGSSQVITTSLTGSTLGKNYSWSNGERGVARTSITTGTAGNYCVTVTNAVGCSASACVSALYNGTTNTVNFTSPLGNGQRQWAGCPLVFKNTSAKFAAPWVAIFDPVGNGSDILTITDGDQYIQYTYSAPGVYQVKLTMDSAGCIFTKVQNVTITSKPSNVSCDPFNAALTVSLGANKAVCSGNAIVLSPTVANGTPPYAYTWNTVSGDALNCNNCQYPTTTITQNSTYKVTVTDAQSQTATATVSYTVKSSSNMQLSVTNTHIDCANLVDTTVVTITNGDFPFTFNWDDGNFTQGPSPHTHMYTQPGTYLISVADSNGCVVSIANTIENRGVNVSLLEQVNPKCVNDVTGKLVVTGTGGIAPYTFKWSNGPTTDSITNLPAKTYNVTVTDVNNCIGTASYAVYVQTWNFYAYVTATNANCADNGSVSTIVTGGKAPLSFLWSNNATSQNLTGVGDGTYTLEVTDSLGCTVNAQATVKRDCKAVISGTVFNDANGNCIIDGSEKGLPGQMVVAERNGEFYYGYTKSNGTFSIKVNGTGTFTLNAETYLTCGTTVLCGSPTPTVTITNPGDTAANNYITFGNNPGFDLSLYLSWNNANPGFTKNYYINPYNLSPTSFTGVATVTFKYDSNLVYKSALGAVHNIADHTLTWMIDSIDYYWNQSTQLSCSFTVPLSLDLGYTLKSDFTITPTSGDCDPSNNFLHMTELVRGSYDPNEKESSIKGYAYEDDLEINYTIHFQNTGTDSTHFIIVRDTLPAELNPATVRTLASSHPYSNFEVTEQGILTWTFEPLRLVDSITNPEGSKGFVSFKVDRRADRPLGAVIRNSAAIYFDYNKPVITNTVADTIAIRTGIVKLTSAESITVTLFPNPSNSKVTVTVAGFTPQWITLFDLNGKKVTEYRYNGAVSTQIDIEALSSGIYFVEVKGQEGSVRKKLVKE